MMHVQNHHTMCTCRNEYLHNCWWCRTLAKFTDFYKLSYKKYFQFEYIIPVKHFQHVQKCVCEREQCSESKLLITWRFRDGVNRGPPVVPLFCSLLLLNLYRHLPFDLYTFNNRGHLQTVSTNQGPIVP